MIYPNLYIIGAPKCGTTSLVDYLKYHDDIFIPECKEPHYFNTDIPHKSIIKDKDLYEDIYKISDCKIKCDASTSYLYSRDAVANFKRAVPDAKIIVMLRKPSDMVFSWYNELKWQGDENIETFPEAWKYRSILNQLPENRIHNSFFFNYGVMGRYSIFIERLYKVVSRDNVKIILLDDLKKTPQQVMDSIFEFLDIKKISYDAFPISNAKKKAKFSFISSIINNKPNWLIRLIFNFKKITGIRSLKIGTIITRLNTKKNEDVLSEHMKQELNDYFHEDVLNLEKIINRNLDDWKKISL